MSDVTRLNNDLKMSELRDIGYAALDLADALTASHADADVLLVAVILVQRRLTRGKPLVGKVAKSIAEVAERTVAHKQREASVVIRPEQDEDFAP